MTDTPPRRQQRSRNYSVGGFRRRRFERHEPALTTLLREPLTHLLMHADGVDREDLVGSLNDLADKLRRQEIDRAGARERTAGIDDRQYRAGVGIILLNARNEVFVGRRRDVKGTAWQLPQGGIDEGEAPRQAVLRELREEVGTDRVEIVAETAGWLCYDVPKTMAKRAWDGQWRGQRQKWFVMRLIGADSEIDVATAHPEFDRWQWIPLRHLPRIAVSFKRQLYLRLVGEFAEMVDGFAPRLPTEEQGTCAG